MNLFIARDKTAFELQPHTHSWLPVTSKQNLHVCWDDCYSQELTSKNRWYYAPVLTSKYAIRLQTFTCYIHIYAIMFSAELNTFRVDQVNRQIDNRISAYVFSSQGVAWLDTSQVWYTHTLTVWQAKEVSEWEQVVPLKTVLRSYVARQS